MAPENLDSAYAADDPAALKTLYRDWATTYDDEFAKARGYMLPGMVASRFAEEANANDAPVLDVGAGTGLIGAALPSGNEWQLHALDPSQEMLDQARHVSCYRAFFAEGLDKFVAKHAGKYGGVVSSGTFTHGHLGPEFLQMFVDCIRPGGLAVMSINQAHFEKTGFQEAFVDLVGKITEPRHEETRIYSNPAGDGHDEDLALITSFRRV